MTLDEFLAIDWNSESFIKAVQILKAAFNSGFIDRYTTLSLGRIQVYDETGVMLGLSENDHPSFLANLSLRKSKDEFSQFLRLVILKEKITIYNRTRQIPIQGLDEIDYSEIKNILEKYSYNSSCVFI